MTNIIDSSAWLEYFAGTKNAAFFEVAIEDQSNLVVPTIILYEVFKKILFEANESEALEKIAHMKQGIIIDLTVKLAIDAARLSKTFKIPMADSIILATAEEHNAVIWTMDEDFRNIPNVKYFSKD